MEVEEEVRTEQQSIRGPQRERRTIKFFRHDHHIYHNRHNRWLCNFLRKVSENIGMHYFQNKQVAELKPIKMLPA